jgi:hypothetical protein
MDTSVKHELNRREILAGGLAFGAALLAGGCQSGGRWKPLSQDELNRPIDRPGPYTPRGPINEPPTALGGVIPRREWTAFGPIAALANPMNGVSRLTVHHDGMDAFLSTSKADAARRLDGIRKAHLAQQWADIGYHYIIDPAGRVWEGRPAYLQGAHVKDNNEHNIGVMVMGNFELSQPTAAALATLDTFVGQLMRRYRIPLDRVRTHREIMPTACPGRNLQSYMVATRGSSGRLAQA